METRLPIIVCLALLLACNAAVGQQTDEQLAAYHYDNGELAQAAQLYESLYSRGQNKYHYSRLLDTYMRMGEYRDAMRLVERRMKEHRADLSLLVDQGHIHEQQHNRKKAEACFDKAIGQVTADQQPVPDLAQAFVRTGHTDRAIATYLAARAKTQNPSLYFNELTSLYQKQGDYGAMTAQYFDLIDGQPGMMQSVQASLGRALQEAPDQRLADGVRAALVDRVRSHPENRTYQDMLLWFALQESDFMFALEQARAIDARYPGQGTEQLMRVASIALKNGSLDVAAEAYKTVQAKGRGDDHYFAARTGELEVEHARLQGGHQLTPQAYKEMKAKYQSTLEELGRNEKSATLMRHYADLLAYHGTEQQQAVDLLDDLLDMKRLPAKVRDSVKLELADLLLFAGEPWDASLLYSQVEKSNREDLLGSAAKFRNARLSYFTHDFTWAASQLNVLRSSTSKLIANDAMELSLLISDNMDDDSTYNTLEPFADADLLLYRGMLDQAWEKFDAVERSSLFHPLHDETMLRKAQIRARQQRYTEADSILARLADHYPDDITADDAIFMRAEINEQFLGDPDTAMQCYERLLLDYPTSLYTERARQRYNALKKR
ncbi:MAG: tetratricopeptide repeat protein [Bacteroidales bacterium]|nr:tetratricopeptide repeat protein [Bacteroidales bacterium]